MDNFIVLGSSVSIVIEQQAGLTEDQGSKTVGNRDFSLNRPLDCIEGPNTCVIYLVRRGVEDGEAERWI